MERSCLPLPEPHRMWKRTLVTNSIFVWLVLKEFIGKRRASGPEPKSTPNLTCRFQPKAVFGNPCRGPHAPVKRGGVSGAGKDAKATRWEKQRAWSIERRARSKERRAEDRRQRTEDRRQKTEDRRQRTEVRAAAGIREQRSEVGGRWSEGNISSKHKAEEHVRGREKQGSEPQRSEGRAVFGHFIRNVS